MSLPSLVLEVAATALAIVDDMEPGDRERGYAEVVEGLCLAGDHGRAREVALRVALETPAVPTRCGAGASTADLGMP